MKIGGKILLFMIAPMRFMFSMWVNPPVSFERLVSLNTWACRNTANPVLTKRSRDIWMMLEYTIIKQEGETK